MQLIPADSRDLCELRHLLVIVDDTKLEPLESLCHAIAAITYATMMAVVVGYRANHYLDRCMLPLSFLSSQNSCLSCLRDGRTLAFKEKREAIYDCVDDLGRC